MWELKATPSGVILRRRPREKTWKPAHEAVEAAGEGHDLVAGAEQEVVGVAEEDLHAQVVQVARLEGLHGGLRPDGHEDGGLDVAVGGMQDAPPGGEAAPGRGGGEEGEGGAGHRLGGYARKAA